MADFQFHQAFELVQQFLPKYYACMASSPNDIHQFFAESGRLVQAIHGRFQGASSYGAIVSLVSSFTYSGVVVKDLKIQATKEQTVNAVVSGTAYIDNIESIFEQRLVLVPSPEGLKIFSEYMCARTGDEAGVSETVADANAAVPSRLQMKRKLDAILERLRR